MHPKAIRAIRDLALSFEKSDVQVAYELMEIAYKERPSGPLIKQKYLEYKEKLEKLKKPLSNEKLKELLETGEVVIIPVGFRCHTKMMIKNKLGYTQPSLPFDSGFFPPVSVASIFRNPEVSMSYDDESHAVCKKYEAFQDSERGKGIKFETSSYDEINSLVKSVEGAEINQYLDSTFGYYTLDKEHNFVLAHYNWHELASDEKSKGIRVPEGNIPLINTMFNKRIERMLEMCVKAKHIFFVYLIQNGSYLKLDDTFYDLADFSELKNVLDDKYNFQYSILDLQNITSETIVGIYDEATGKVD
ncbi:hypothetical protein [Oceanobacter mangrovi]|uniref:hypothetical protein n=1 Tax=Oceanobacter mangrovi TaxID=2862510 RepID=UPI001C8D9F22|nr:hypothetical protein [Oceanobacter mangrovi]